MRPTFLTLCACLLFLLASGQSSPNMTIVPGALWLDNRGAHINAHGGGILSHNGRYYWYGEHKVGGELGNTAQVGVSCYSSDDLVNWENEGIALAVDNENPQSDIARGCVLERPKVIFNPLTGKFVMWFHLELKGHGYLEARSGVAVSDLPTGPYTFVKSFRPNAGFWPLNVQPCHHKPLSPDLKKDYCGGKGCLPAHPDSVNILGRDFTGGQMARDMNLFVDDDGTAYHIYASEENSTLHISKLTPDYLSCSGEYIRAFTGRYMEAPAMFKHDGKYYLIASDCTGWAPNAARSATADSILGEWSELGNPCEGEGADLTFHSQSTYILPMPGRAGEFIFMADRWSPKDAIDGRYIWLPFAIEKGRPVIRWSNHWDMSQSLP